MEVKDPRDGELVHDAMQDRAYIARYLRAIAEGLETGRLRLASGDRQLELTPPSLCTFELRTTSERQRFRLQVAVGWREPDGKPDGELEISSG
jgi:amphi-Trp domain-containing protein